MSPQAATIDIVIKMGGALLRDPRLLALAIDGIDRLACGDDRADGRSMTCLVVPGGGPFADAVRMVDACITLGDDMSHWTAIRAMDQYAHILAARSSKGTIVESMRDATTVASRGRLPILAPYRYLRAVDPLPHSWSVTSDSIAAWIALTGHARALVLVKAATGPQAAVTDPYLPSLLSDAAATGRHLMVRICTPGTLLATVADCRVPARVVTTVPRVRTDA